MTVSSPQRADIRLSAEGRREAARPWSWGRASVSRPPALWPHACWTCVRHSGAGRTHCRAPGGSEHDTPPATYGTEGCAARGRPPPPGAAWGTGSPPPASAPAAGVLPCPGPRLWCWWRVFTLLVSGDSGLRACEACAESHGHSPTSRGQGPPRAQPPRPTGGRRADAATFRAAVLAPARLRLPALCRALKDTLFF